VSTGIGTRSGHSPYVGTPGIAVGDHPRMWIFISSVRRGLESERDSLRGLITALGHTPVRFEHFGPQSTPSRQA
jgi:Domain of unknown function (DUF4062)